MPMYGYRVVGGSCPEIDRSSPEARLWRRSNGETGPAPAKATPALADPAPDLVADDHVAVTRAIAP